MSARVPPPLVGFNNNVRYRGTSFHIQTEDSGVARPRVVTHLFIDGGHVIKTLRTDYSEHVNRPDCRDVVQRIMRDQHRAMAQELRKGRLDAIIDRLLLGPARTKSEKAISSKPGPSQPGSQRNPGNVEPEAAEPKSRRKKAARSRTPVRNQKSPRSSSAKSGSGDFSAASSDLHAAPGGDSIFGLPRESLDELILGYVAQSIE